MALHTNAFMSIYPLTMRGLIRYSATSIILFEISQNKRKLIVIRCCYRTHRYCPILSNEFSYIFRFAIVELKLLQAEMPSIRDKMNSPSWILLRRLYRIYPELSRKGKFKPPRIKRIMILCMLMRKIIKAPLYRSLSGISIINHGYCRNIGIIGIILIFLLQICPSGR